MKVNKFEDELLHCMAKANVAYEDMTAGWLGHAPESFFQVMTAHFFSKKTDYFVGVEESPKSITESDSPRRGRKSTKNIRFDMIVWKKGEGLKAIAEFKTLTLNKKSLKSDAKKMRKYRRGDAKLARYFCHYRELQDREKLNTEHKKIAKILNANFLGRIGGVDKHKDYRSGEFHWEVSLYRLVVPRVKTKLTNQ